MKEIFISILTEPFYSFITAILLIVAWTGFFYLKKPENRTFLKYELGWLIVGLLGVFFLVNDNSIKLHNNELKGLNSQIKSKHHDLDYFYMNLDYYRSILEDNDSIHTNKGKLNQRYFQFIRSLSEELDNIADDDYKRILKYKEFDFKQGGNYFNHYYVISGIKKLNELIESKIQLEKIRKGEMLTDLKYSIGILLLLMAFAIRISITLYKLISSKGLNRG